jgi:transposase
MTSRTESIKLCPMEKRDFRSLGRETQEALRVRAVFLVLQLHKTQAEAAEAVGVSRQVVNQWMRNYASEGEKALLDRRANTHRRGKGRLTDAEARRVQDWIRDKCPEQLKLPYALWTAGVVRELIHRRLGKHLGLSTVQLYLLKWGFTPQKPLSRATQRSDARIQHWLEREYPKIARRARREKALIYWGDETGVSNQDQIGRSYAPKGQTPVVRQTAKKLTTSMISAVNNRGLMRFMCFKGALNAGLFITFLGRLIKDAPGKVFLIVDNLRVHKAVKVSEWVEAHKDEIELHFLPPYAPEHNPDEYLNNDLKQKLKNLPRPDSHEDLVQATSSVLRSLQRQPHRIRAYFHHGDVRYAA